MPTTVAHSDPNAAPPSARVTPGRPSTERIRRWADAVAFCVDNPTEATDALIALGEELEDALEAAIAAPAEVTVPRPTEISILDVERCIDPDDPTKLQFSAKLGGVVIRRIRLRGGPHGPALSMPCYREDGGGYRALVYLNDSLGQRVLAAAMPHLATMPKDGAR